VSCATTLVPPLLERNLKGGGGGREQYPDREGLVSGRGSGVQSGGQVSHSRLESNKVPFF
jgi:hypothetical protein